MCNVYPLLSVYCMYLYVSLSCLPVCLYLYLSVLRADYINPGAKPQKLLQKGVWSTAPEQTFSFETNRKDLEKGCEGCTKKEHLAVDKKASGYSHFHRVITRNLADLVRSLP